MLSRFRFRHRHGAVDCDEVGRVLHAYLDGELDGDRLGLLAAHLEACRHCGLDAEAYNQIKGALTTRGDRRVDTEAIDRLRMFGLSLTHGPSGSAGR